MFVVVVYDAKVNQRRYHKAFGDKTRFSTENFEEAYRFDSWDEANRAAGVHRLNDHNPARVCEWQEEAERVGYEKKLKKAKHSLSYQLHAIRTAYVLEELDDSED